MQASSQNETYLTHPLADTHFSSKSAKSLVNKIYEVESLKIVVKDTAWPTV